MELVNAVPVAVAGNSDGGIKLNAGAVAVQPRNFKNMQFSHGKIGGLLASP